MAKSKDYTIKDLVLVSIEKISKSFDGNLILGDVNIEIKDVVRLDDDSIKQAQVVSILGPSGVGKTTLFNVMAGLLEPDCGVVLIDNPATPPLNGTIREDLIPTHRGLVGVVYQDYRLLPFQTVYEALEAGLEYSRGKSNYADGIKKIDEYLSWFGLMEHKTKFPSQLSGGQRQRVAISQQLLRNPQLLLMDEPFSGLDPETKDEVVDMISCLAQKDEFLTIVLISHDIVSSLRVSDTIYMMGKNRNEKGEIIPGASIQHDKTIDLKKLGLAWSYENPNDLETRTKLAELAVAISNEFHYLSGKN